MKDLSPLFIVALICLAAPLFLPYMEYDVREFHGFFSLKPRMIIAVDQVLYGSQTAMSYFPLIWVLIPVLLLLRKKSKANLIVSLIFSILLVFIMVVLYFALTARISFYNGYENVSLGLGYWLSFLGSGLMLAGSIRTLGDLNKEKSIQHTKKDSNPELLDDSI